MTKKKQPKITVKIESGDQEILTADIEEISEYTTHDYRRDGLNPNPPLYCRLLMKGGVIHSLNTTEEIKALVKEVSGRIQGPRD